MYKHIISLFSLFAFFTNAQTIQTQDYFHRGNNNEDVIYDVVSDAFGNTYITGAFTGTVDFNPDTSSVYNLSTNAGYTNTDAFVQKLDSNGNLVWAKKFYSNHDAIEAGTNLSTDTFGNIYIAGYYTNDIFFDYANDPFLRLNGAPGKVRPYLTKFDSAGVFQWGLAWSKSASSTQLVDGFRIRDIATSADGKVYVTGSYSDSVDFDPTNASVLIKKASAGTDIFILRIDSSGQFEKVRSIGGNDKFNVGLSVNIDPTGDLILSGEFNDTIDFDNGPGADIHIAKLSDIFITKMDTGFNHIWAKTFGSGDYDNITSTLISKNGDVYNIGYTGGDIDLNPGPATLMFYPKGSDDLFIQKLDSSGILVWAKMIGGFHYATVQSRDALLLENEDLLIVGRFVKEVDFDPSYSSTYNLQSNGHRSDAFVVRYDAGGNFISAQSYGGNQNDLFYAVEATGNRDIMVGGYFQGSMNTDPSGNGDTITSAGQEDMILLHLKSCSFDYDTIEVRDCISYTAPSGTQVYTQSGTYVDVLSGTMGCDSMLTIHLTLDTVGIDKTANYSNGELSSNHTDTVSTYQWIDCATKQPLANATQQNYTPTYNGDYAVVIDNGSCIDTSQCVNVNDISIAESLQNSLIVYPNPTTGIVRIESPYTITEVEVLDMTGRVVLKSEQTPLNLVGIHQGIYVLRIKTESGVVVKRVWKE